MPEDPQTTPLPPSTLTNAPPTTPATNKPSDFPLPKLRLEIRDLTHDGTSRVLTALDISDCIATGVHNVLRLLYTSPSHPSTTAPGTRSVTFIFRSMGGVAHTIGSDLDSDHKEVHFSLDYIRDISNDRVAHEITGVVTHELVHCFQYNGHGTCPGGLIEGIADWVRLNCDLAPPHWKKETSEKWDGGYQHTAYFLQYIEGLFGDGSVQRINEKLRLEKYENDSFWTGLFGVSVEELWEAYSSTLEQ
ncbi:hypothetical protein VHEMI04626 [[Torrubiella] hemipterigena]|uniref:Plant Basic Secretory protein n=1 Tax=[Torrubiella] hemipterigena TaxID=1531966 RepID=A0A0A1T1T8_9HYPO|nr:hypothetical protein VHEMI04626 [[Torrubiella] hemipterigena]